MSWPQRNVKYQQQKKVGTNRFIQTSNLLWTL